LPKNGAYLLKANRSPFVADEKVVFLSGTVIGAHIFGCEFFLSINAPWVSRIGAPLRVVPFDEAIARSGFPGASAKEQTANRATIAVNGQIADAAAHFGGKAQVVVLR
jgi:hypothetical protein